MIAWTRRYSVNGLFFMSCARLSQFHIGKFRYDFLLKNQSQNPTRSISKPKIISQNKNLKSTSLVFCFDILDICMSTSKQDVRNNRRLTAVVIRATSLAYITQKAGFSRGAAVIQHRSFVTQSNKILRNS